MSKNIFLGIAGVFGGLGVASGAFASHALKESLTEKAIAIWETASKYQMYHSLGLLLIAILMTNESLSLLWLKSAGIAFIVGIILFSGSLYALSLTGEKWLGAITPIGGVAFLIGWTCLVLTSIQSSS